MYYLFGILGRMSYMVDFHSSCCVCLVLLHVLFCTWLVHLGSLFLWIIPYMSYWQCHPDVDCSRGEYILLARQRMFAYWCPWFPPLYGFVKEAVQFLTLRKVFQLAKLVYQLQCPPTGYDWPLVHSYWELCTGFWLVQWHCQPQGGPTGSKRRLRYAMPCRMRFNLAFCVALCTFPSTLVRWRSFTSTFNKNSSFNVSLFVKKRTC
jgi:hypothetical protein